MTGATGVVGAPILRLLVESGRRVGALVRSAGSAESVEMAGATAVNGDSSTTAHWSGLHRVRCGLPRGRGRSSVSPTPSPWIPPMSTGRATSSERARSRVRRLVYTSSAAAIGEEEGTGR